MDSSSTLGVCVRFAGSPSTMYLVSILTWFLVAWTAVPSWGSESGPQAPLLLWTLSRYILDFWWHGQQFHPGGLCEVCRLPLLYVPCLDTYLISGGMDSSSILGVCVRSAGSPPLCTLFLYSLDFWWHGQQFHPWGLCEVCRLPLLYVPCFYTHLISGGMDSSSTLGVCVRSAGSPSSMYLVSILTWFLVAWTAVPPWGSVWGPQAPPPLSTLSRYSLDFWWHGQQFHPGGLCEVHRLPLL